MATWRHRVLLAAIRVGSVGVLLIGLAAVAVADFGGLIQSASAPASGPASGPAPRPASGPAGGAAQVYTSWPFSAEQAAARQDQTAKALGLPKEMSLDLGHGASMKFILIPAGRFLMGEPNAKILGLNTAPPHMEYKFDPSSFFCEVTLTKPFYMGVYLVTRGQFAAFVADSNYVTEAEKCGYGESGYIYPFKPMPKGSWKDPGFEQTDDHPVVDVGYGDNIAFCKWFSKKSGRTVKLPTAAQWEFACRAGTMTVYPWGDHPDGGKGSCNGYDVGAKNAMVEIRGKASLDYTCYFNWDDGFVYTSPVGTFKPNAFGLYDMLGNAKQYCSDFWEKDHGLKVPKVDPQGPARPGGEEMHAIRGGGWSAGPPRCSAGDSEAIGVCHHTNNMGIRVIVEIEP